MFKVLRDDVLKITGIEKSKEINFILWYPDKRVFSISVSKRS